MTNSHLVDRNRYTNLCLISMTIVSNTPKERIEPFPFASRWQLLPTLCTVSPYRNPVSSFFFKHTYTYDVNRCAIFFKCLLKVYPCWRENADWFTLATILHTWGSFRQSVARVRAHESSVPGRGELAELGNALATALMARDGYDSIPVPTMRFIW